MRTTAYFGLAAMLMLAVVAPVFAQEQSTETADVKAYRPIYDPNTPADRKAELAEAFFAETSPVFAESMWRDNVYLFLFSSYRSLKNWPKVLDTVDRLEKLVPKTPVEKKVAYYEHAMDVAGAELKDVKKTLGYAEKILTLNPKHLYALLALATAIPEKATEAELNKTIEYAKRVLALDKPEGVTDDRWKTMRHELEVQNQTIVSMMILDKKDYVGCAKAYEDLTRLSPKDSAAFYRLGICLYYQVRSANELAVAANVAHRTFIGEPAKEGQEGTGCNKDLTCDSEENKVEIEKLAAKFEEKKKVYEDLREKAIEAFAKAVAIGGGGPEIAAARTELEKLYRAKQPALEGLDDLINQKRKELGD